MRKQPDAPHDEAEPVAQPAGYVPAFEGADGQEDPAPVPVVKSVALPPSPAATDPLAEMPPDAATAPESAGHLSSGNEADDQPAVAEEISFDQQSDQVRHVGRLPDPDQAVPGSPVTPADALIRTLGRPAQPPTS